MRCQQIRQKGKEEEVSPIFHQFIDCVWQVLNQYPRLFEFNARYLQLVADSIYSGRFGTFLADTDKERERHEVDNKCLSVFDYLLVNRATLENPLYSPGPSESHVLLPPLSQFLRKVTIWGDYYFRWNELSTVPTSSSEDTEERQEEDEDEDLDRAQAVDGVMVGEECKADNSRKAVDMLVDFDTDFNICSLQDRVAVFEEAYLNEKKEKEALITRNEELMGKIERLTSALGEKGLECYGLDLLTK